MTWNLALIDGPIEIPEDDGYHLNVAPEVGAEVDEQYKVYPNSPDQVFAGAETVFLRFDSIETAKAALMRYWYEDV